MIRHNHRLGTMVLRNLMCFFLAFQIIGLGFTYGQGMRIQKNKAVSIKSNAASYVVSVGTIKYQGTDSGNIVQTVSRAKVMRQGSGKVVDYSMAATGGMRVGKNMEILDFDISPLHLSRNTFSEEISGAGQGLDLSLYVVNETLSRIAQKQLGAGKWEHTIALSLGEAFPKQLNVQFAANHADINNRKVIVITANSGMLSYRGMDENNADLKIFGRYKGVLIYSPEDNELYQAASAFTIYKEEEQLRIEQMHYATDASGQNPRYPLADVRSFLGRDESSQIIGKEGPFPPWAVQALRVFDVIHTAIMTAGEGYTNPFFPSTCIGSIWQSVGVSSRWQSQLGITPVFKESFNTAYDRFSKWLQELSETDPGSARWHELLMEEGYNFIKHMVFMASTEGFASLYFHAIPTTMLAMEMVYIKYKVDMMINEMTAAKKFSYVQQPSDLPEPPPVNVKKSGGGGGLGLLPIVIGAAGAAILTKSLLGGGNKQCCKNVNDIYCPVAKVCCPGGSKYFSPSTKGCYSLTDAFYKRVPKDAEMCNAGPYCTNSGT
jgi:hypothetical protein